MVTAMDPERRVVVKRLGQGLAGLCLAGGAVLAARFARPPRVADYARRLDLGLATALPAGSSLHQIEADVHVVHGPEGLYALSGKCTHLGCSVLRQAEGFACPCHGARFDALGQLLSGPAPRGLTWYALSVDGQRRLWLHLDQEVKPGTCLRV
jgi:Rieske Fe-S protein